MVESKSGYLTNDFNAHSEKRVEFNLKGLNRLADDSEQRRRRFSSPIVTTPTIATATSNRPEGWVDTVKDYRVTEPTRWNVKGRGHPC